MKLGTLLLGTAAAFVAVSGAQAADLPGEPVPAAVDYVKVCDTFGAGFFYIPGTETCLDISGRVRYTAAYIDPIGGGDFVRTRADARVDFDARTATEYGQLRSFFRIAAGGGRGEPVFVENAFIQLGYLTAGLVGGLFNGDVLYGINDAFVGSDENVAIQVVVDDLGGGFFVGASVEGQSYNAQTDYETDLSAPNAVGVVGIAGQPWGDASLSFMYQSDGNATDFSGLDPITTSDTFGVKATGNFVLTEGFDVRATAAYFSEADASDDVILLSLAAKYAVTEAADLYAGIRYDIVDGDDSIFANVGVDYEVVPGLIATGEVAYADVGGDDGFGVFGRLTRNW